MTTPIDLKFLDARVAVLAADIANGGQASPVDIRLDVLRFDIQIIWRHRYERMDAAVRFIHTPPPPFIDGIWSVEALWSRLDVILQANPTPSIAIPAIIAHLAALTDAEAARWTAQSAALRALVTP